MSGGGVEGIWEINFRTNTPIAVCIHALLVQPDTPDDITSVLKDVKMSYLCGVILSTTAVSVYFILLYILFFCIVVYSLFFERCLL